MTISKAELIAVVNSTLNRGYNTAGTVLDEKITSALKDLSTRGDFLQDEFKRVTAEDRDYYSLPDNFKNLLFCGLKSSDDATIYKPLVFERFAMYKRNIYYSSTTGTPTRYTWMSGYMYPRPIPDDIYNMYWWYSYIHPETIDEVKACDSILFADRYRKAIELRLLYEVAEGLNLDSDAKKYNALYLLDEVPRLISLLPKQIHIACYRDGF
ncbi:MAG TPA: hypothetical protein VMV86_04940 [Methanosarcinales archaeon]|nr:hypothetical protein [Methanosarcinales archaeon]